MTQGIPEAAADPAAQHATSYAAACADVLSATNAAAKPADTACKARAMAEQRPQHEISIENFRRLAEGEEQKFAPLYKAFVASCTTARDAAARFRAACGSDDPDVVLFQSAGPDAWQQAGTAAHILRASFGPTPAGFMNGLAVANDDIQTDDCEYGEPGFISNVYAPPQPTERTCPWCAETIKAAAIVCRFCGRDVPPLGAQPVG